jgi:hypothetical protein
MWCIFENQLGFGIKKIVNQPELCIAGPAEI